jgi:hypothetical protein
MESHELIGILAASLTVEDSLEYAHRVLFILDDLKEDEDAISDMKNYLQKNISKASI